MIFPPKRSAASALDTGQSDALDEMTLGEEVDHRHRQHIAQHADGDRGDGRKVHAQSDGDRAPQLDQRDHGYEEYAEIFHG